MMFRIAYFVVFALALGTIGCSSDNVQQNSITATRLAVSPVVEQPKPIAATPPVSTSPAELTPAPESTTPAQSKPKLPTYRVRHAVAVPTPTVQCVSEESRTCELATEILNVPTSERVAWAKQEFAKRGINDVRDDQ